MGIGTSSPGATLHVSGGAIRIDDSQQLQFGNGNVRINNDASGRMYLRAPLAYYFEGNGGYKMVLDGNSGNLGIGTTSPAQKLDVVGSAQITNDIYLGRYIFHDDDTNTWLGFPLADTISFRTNGSDRMYINSSGNVGIGTTNPSYKLDIAGDLRVDNGDLGGTSGDEVTHAKIQGKRHFIDFKEVRTANDTDWRNTTFKIQTGVDSTNHQSIDFVSDGSYQEHIDIRTGNQLFNTRFTYDGKVGIGTTNPAKKLTIGGIGIGNTDGLKIEDPSNTAYGAHYSYDDGSTTVEIGGVVNNSLRDCISIARDATRTITIDTSERVGIGTTSPQAKLHVANGTLRTWTPTTGTSAIFESTVNSRNFLTLTAANEAELWFGNASTQTLGRVRYEMSTNNMEFWTNATQKMVIEGGGNVGIGTTSPRTKLHVFGTVSSMPASGAAPSAAQLGGSSYGTLFSTLTSGRGVIQQGRSDGTAGTYDLLLQPVGGNVGIGESSPSSKLYIQGSTSTTSSQLMRIRSTTSFSTTPGRIIEFIRSNNTIRGYISMNQYGVQYNTSSDYRLKENITPINDALDRLKKLKPNRFSWKEGPSDYKVDGFIAHEVAEVIPEAISGEKDAVDENNKPSYQGIDQAKIVPLLTAALQEAVTKIEQLETRIQTLENK